MGNFSINRGGINTNLEGMPSIDLRYGPYPTKQAAIDRLGANDLDVITEGLTVGIQPTAGASVVEWWFQPDGQGGLELVEKQSASVEVDTNPTEGSDNPVSSGGVYTALEGKVQKPSQQGTTGQVLKLGANGTVWGDVRYQDIVDGLAYGGIVGASASLTPDTGCYYITNGPGTYTAFGSVVVASGEEHVQILTYDGTQWQVTDLPWYTYSYAHGKFDLLNVMAGATASVPGIMGFVPAPAAGDQEKILQGDGTWAQKPSDGKSAYEVWLEVNNYDAAQHPVSEYLDSLKGEQGVTGNPGHNPNLGTYMLADIGNAPTIGILDGDYIVVVDDTTPPATATIYKFNGLSWETTGKDADSVEFGSGELLASVGIDSSQLSNPAANALAKATDAAKLARKLSKVTLDENNITDTTEWYPSGESNGYYKYKSSGNTVEWYSIPSDNNVYGYYSSKIAIPSGTKNVRLLVFSKNWSNRPCAVFLDENNAILAFEKYNNTTPYGQYEMVLTTPENAAYLVCLTNAWAGGVSYQIFKNTDFYCYTTTGYPAASTFKSGQYLGDVSMTNEVEEDNPNIVTSGGVFEYVEGVEKELLAHMDGVKDNLNPALLFTSGGYYKSDSLVVQGTGTTNMHSTVPVDISQYETVEIVAPSYNANASDVRACLITDENNVILSSLIWQGYETTTNKKLLFNIESITGAKYLYVSYSTNNCPQGINVIGKISEGTFREELDNMQTQIDNLMVNGSAPYIHISFDDMTAPFQWLADNYSTVSSIYDESMFNLLKTLHDTYGAVFTLNCFQGGLTALATAGNKFASEFVAAADWLKFSFHAQAGGISYDPNTTNTYSPNAATDYATFVQSIESITGSVLNIDQAARLGYFEGSVESILAFKNQPMGIYAFLGADTNNRTSYYLGTNISKLLWKNGHWYDAQNGVFFVSTNIYRLDRKDSDTTLSAEETIATTQLTDKSYAEVFMHQVDLFSDTTNDTLYTSRGNVALEAFCKVAKQLGYVFDYTTRHIKLY